MLFADEDLASGEYGWTRPYCIWSRIASLMVWSTSQVIVAFGRPITGDPRPKPPWAPFLCIHRSRDTGPTNAFHADGVGDSRQHPTVDLASCVDGVNQAIKFMRESGQSQPGAPLVLQNIPASSTLGSRHSRIHRS